MHSNAENKQNKSSVTFQKSNKFVYFLRKIWHTHHISKPKHHSNKYSNYIDIAQERTHVICLEYIFWVREKKQNRRVLISGARIRFSSSFFFFKSIQFVRIFNIWLTDFFKEEMVKESWQHCEWGMRNVQHEKATSRKLKSFCRFVVFSDRRTK